MDELIEGAKGWQCLKKLTNAITYVSLSREVLRERSTKKIEIQTRILVLQLRTYELLQIRSGLHRPML